MHAITPYLRSIARREAFEVAGAGSRPDAREAEALWGAVLDGTLPELEVGALVASLTVAGESTDELIGLHRAVASRCIRLSPTLDRRAVSIPVYGLLQGEAAFAALLALFLRRFGVPSVLHGCLESSGQSSAARLLRELDVLPCACAVDAEVRLRDKGVAFVPPQLLSPAFANVLSLRARLGMPNSAHRVAMALDPGGMGCVRIVAVVPGSQTVGLAPFLAASGGDALLLAWPPGEGPANVALRPRITWLSNGSENVLFEIDGAGRPPLAIPGEQGDAARWVRAVIEGHLPVPGPLVKLAASCLLATGLAPDIAQAKALVALQSGRFAAGASLNSL
jgi:anthranilate phosphoribosyltransferase